MLILKEYIYIYIYEYLPIYKPKWLNSSVVSFLTAFYAKFSFIKEKICATSENDKANLMVGLGG